MLWHMTLLTCSFIMILWHLGFFFFFLQFILRERACMHKWARGRERERKRENTTGSTLSVQSLMQGCISQTMRSWPELKPRVGCLTNWATLAPLASSLSTKWGNERRNGLPDFEPGEEQGRNSRILYSQVDFWAWNFPLKGDVEPRMPAVGFRDFWEKQCCVNPVKMECLDLPGVFQDTNTGEF